MRRTTLLLIILCLMGRLYADTQEKLQTVVVGEVYDSQTLEPLENINLAVTGMNYGVTTNQEGIFLLRLEIAKKVKVVVSGIGYHKYTFEVEPGVDAGIDIALEEKNTQLQEVFVAPGTNPANTLMARVRACREQNDAPLPVDQMDSRTRVFLSDVYAKHLNKTLWRNVQTSMLLQEDSSFLLPIYSRETKDGTQRVHSSLLSESDYETLLSGLETPPDFYNNLVSLYSTSFLSPLASDGSTYYRFYLIDSLESATGKHYLVDFRTRNPYYATFNGQMEIDSATAALVHITANVPQQVNANYLKNATIEQFYSDETSDNPRELHRSQTNLLLDVAVKGDNSHTFPSALVTQSQERRCSTIQPSPITSEALPVNENELVDSVEAAIDTLADTPLFRTARFFAYMIQTGYIPTGSYVEIGNVTELLKITPQEVLRLGIPLRTSEKLWKNVCLEAYAAYGFGDQAWKGAGAVHVNLPTPRRHQLTFRYADEYVYSDVSDFTLLRRENAAWFRYMGFTTAIMRTMYEGNKHNYNPAVRQREFRIQSEDDWTDHLESQFRIAIGRMGYGEPSRDYNSQSSFRYAHLSATFRISWGERKADLYFRRIHVYSNKPVVYLNGEIGSFCMDQEENRFSSDYQLYGKLRLMVRHQVPLGVAGQLDYLVEGGMVFGAVPYTLLTIFDGNQSYAYDSYRFSLMHNYRFAADKYILLDADWNGRGCLFNLIPGIRCLRLRELATFKMGYGTLDARHEQVLKHPFASPNVLRLDEVDMPYIEIGVGIGNIFRVGELYSIWRVTHRDEEGAPKWSLRFRLRLDR